MSKKEGAKTVVIGGKQDVRQQYCGIVGGQSSDFSTMDTEVKVWFSSLPILKDADFVFNSLWD